jgi:hypothetical protein
MINIIKDVDLFEHVDEYEAVLIGTGTYCTMSQGIQLKVMLNYPYVYNKNLETKYGDPDKLGTIVQCEQEKSPRFCLCFIYEGNFRPDIRKDYLYYESLEKCLSLVNILYKGKNIATTLLGASRFDGNGDRDRIMEIFERTLTDVNVTIYDYFQKSRAEEMKEVRDNELAVKKVDREAYYQMVAERKRKADERFRKNGHRRY